MNGRSRSTGLALLLAAACSTPAADGVRTGPGGTVWTRLQQPAYDPARHEATCKVWHDVHSPDGVLLTKGQGGRFPHHRGLFVGWNQVRVGASTFDVWHGKAGVSQRRVRQLEAGEHPLGPDWQVQAIDWCDGTGRPFVHERRGLATAPIDASAYLLQLDVTLLAAGERVLLRGDPQHAGIQFRALQQFAEPGAEPVRYLRPTTAKALPDDVWADCAWIAAVLPLASGPVTVLRIELPDNPPAVWSTRDYGRFGAMYDVDLEPGTARRLRVDWVVANGAHGAGWCEQQAAARRRG